jgi:hypothetical protein
MRRIYWVATEFVSNPVQVRTALFALAVSLLVLHALLPGVVIRAEDVVGTGH